MTVPRLRELRLVGKGGAVGDHGVDDVGAGRARGAHGVHVGLGQALVGAVVVQQRAVVTPVRGAGARPVRRGLALPGARVAPLPGSLGSGLSPYPLLHHRTATLCAPLYTFTVRTRLSARDLCVRGLAIAASNMSC